MHVEVPEYLFPKLEQAAKHLNIPLSELVCDALVSYMQDLEDAHSLRTHKDILKTVAPYEKTDTVHAKYDKISL